MARHIATGIDVGTHHVRVVVGEYISKGSRYAKRILGTGLANSKGLHYGYIINSNDAVTAITHAVSEAEKNSGLRIKRAYLSVGGPSLEGNIVSGSVSIARADDKISDMDVERSIKAAENAIPKNAIQNRKILHSVPITYKIDNKEVLGRPAGMKGARLEVKALLITCLSQHLEDLVQAAEEAGVEVEDVIASPIAAGMVNLTKQQRIAGVVLVNVGAETTSLVVYENNLPISLATFDIGSSKITEDIALGLKIPLDEAEEVKVTLDRQGTYPKKKLDEIIEARISDILELVESHLKKIKKDGLLPAGIVLTGGGSGITSIEDLAKAALSLPSSKAELSIASGKGVIRDASWSVSYGLCMLGLSDPSESAGGFRVANKTKESVVGWVKQFLP